jgi:putative porin
VSRTLELLGIIAALVIDAGDAQSQSKLRFGGDFRLRYEHTTDGNGVPSIGKEVVRLRAGLTYPLNDWTMIRARAATGAPGDPNSTDVTLGEFVDDLALSLDLATVELNRPHWGALGGKFNNPFLTTELVWDNDVNPAGLAGRLTLGGQNAFTAGLTAIYFVIDQQANRLGSDMRGGQLGVSVLAGEKWRVTAAGAYYDFRFRSLVNADAGDIRSNRLVLGDTAYLSDFNLLDFLVAVEFSGWGERIPLRVVGDFVRNLALNDGEDTGWEADVYLGRSSSARDVRARYGYALAETDAVVAAFAQDNITMGTNYETHTFAVEAFPIDGLLLNATWYLFRPHEAPAGVRREYQSRLRFNATVIF